jgi:uncharacterized membrane protein YgcG
MNALRRCALALALLLVAAAPADAVERIREFISDVAVQRNGDLIVAETIRVEAEGNVIRRGIFRDFPTVYRRRDGTRVEVGFQVQSVTRNGTTEPYSLERLSNGIRVRIGSADRVIPRGQHTYVIRYVTTRQIGFFADFDELYWNVTGTGWVFPIDMAEARITLPDKVSFKQTAVYTGPQDATGGRDASVIQQQPGYIVFRTMRPLPARNGLTVAAAWEKGVITPPTAAQLASYWLTDNRGLVFALAGLALLLAYYGFAWLRVGRDPPSGTIIPLFGPPDGMSPAATRYVDRMSFDNGCFTAAIISLGVKGRLRIVEKDGHSTLQKQSGKAEVAPEENQVLARLFSGGGALLLSQTNHVPLGKAKNGLDESLQHAYLGKLFANNYGWSTAGLLLAIAIVLAVLFVAPDGQQGVLVIETVIGVPLFMIAAAMMYFGWQRFDRGKWLLISGVIMAAVVLAAATFFTWAARPGIANLVLSGAILAIGAIAAIGFPWLKAPSRSGRKIMDNIEGFREYLSVAEEDRLNALNPPEKTPELFEKFLPYAVALDCQNAWAAKFAGVLAAAGAAAATGWYVGTRDWGSDPAGFASHLSSDLSSTIASSSTAPGSSGNGGGGGSSGGGSSGGGGGGGGGGGW